MKLQEAINILISIIFIGSIFGTSSLVYNEFINGAICPKLLSIPACYIILLCFVIPFISHLLKLNNFIYFTGIGIAFAIAFYGTIMQLSGLVECPKTDERLPICFISLSIFTSLIFFKIVELKKIKSSN